MRMRDHIVGFQRGDERIKMKNTEELPEIGLPVRTHLQELVKIHQKFSSKRITKKGFH